jgi:hypothetical protein
MSTRDPFELTAVVHLVRPWGQPVRDLQGLREVLAIAPPEVLFHHTAQYPLRHPAAEELPRDDLSAWVGAVVRDAETAERMSFAVQSRGSGAEPVREALLAALDALPARRRREHAAPEGGEFLFLAGTAVPIATGVVVNDAGGLVEALLAADPSVWFHHLVEEAWWCGAPAPLIAWVETRRDTRLAAWLAADAGAGLPIDRARARLHRRWKRSRLARGLAEAAHAIEDDRREAGRQVVAALVRRHHHPRGEA